MALEKCRIFYKSTKMIKSHIEKQGTVDEVIKSREEIF